MVGYNYRLTNLVAALCVAQLEQLSVFIENKKKIAEQYKEFFANTEIKFVNGPENTRSNYWLNTIIFVDKRERDNFLKITNEKGIMARPAWELMNCLEMFKKYQTENIENAEWLVDRMVNIPSGVRV